MRRAGPNQRLVSTLSATDWGRARFVNVARRRRAPPRWTVFARAPRRRRKRRRVGRLPANAACAARGIVPQAYSPLGDSTPELISGDLVTSIGAAHNKSGVQVALRWIYQHGVAVTTKSTNAAHLAQDLDIFDWKWTDAEQARADAAAKPKGTPSFMCSK